MNNDKLNTVKNEIKNTMNIMKNNINKVIDRGDRLEDLEAKSGLYCCNLMSYCILYSIFVILHSLNGAYFSLVQILACPSSFAN